MVLALTPQAATPCEAPQPAIAVQIKRVVDGDTLWLRDGRKIRLIGVNTPELGAGDDPAEPLAEEARQYVEQFLLSGAPLRMVVGAEAEDRHGRTLSHIFDRSGRNLSQELLERGLGFAIAHPPNIRLLACLLRAEASARDESRGVWAAGRYPILNSRQLKPTHRGYHRVRGRVVGMTSSRDSWWIDLQGELALRIPTASLRYFEREQLRDLPGREVEVGGWLVYRGQSSKRRAFMMHVYHPASVEVLESEIGQSD